MEGKIHRVVYNYNKCVAELHLKSGGIKEVPMTVDDWESIIKGDIIENLKYYLDE